MNKKQLQDLKNLYEQQLQILDLMLSDMSNTTLDTVHCWLNNTIKMTEDICKENKLNDFNDERYKQITIQEALSKL